MNELSCEDVLMAQMAAADGEEAAFSKEQLTAHLTACVNCQHELKQLLALDHLLASQALADQPVDLWPVIENRIAKPGSSAIQWKLFALIGLLLISYKLLEMLPARDLGLAFKLVPLVIVILLFVLMRENPFRINTELMMER